MIRSRWLSTFTVIGALLIVLGIVGLVMGTKFVYDPGQVSDGNEPWYYILVGVLMIVNGIFSPAPEPSEKTDDAPVEYGDKAAKRETAPPA
ncbi:MAG: hypothetical protein JWQ02_1498 [Capsulimonas sp.]|jgi:uncharacterized membrane protein|nr:hypothetical protein [Capsulimonas sp.]